MNASRAERMAGRLIAVLLAMAIGVATSGAAAAAAELRELEGIGELARLFDRDAGKVRIVLLLSPT